MLSFQDYALLHSTGEDIKILGCPDGWTKRITGYESEPVILDFLKKERKPETLDETIISGFHKRLQCRVRNSLRQ